MKMILAIGSNASTEFKAHKEISLCLERKGVKSVLFKQDLCLEGEYMTFEVKNGIPKYFLIVDGKSYDVDDFEGVLYLHPYLPRQLLEYKPEDHARFISVQFLEMRKALWHFLSQKKWLNNPWKVWEAESKIHQLCVARKVGLNIPNTLITSDPEALKKFYRDNERKIISKILGVSPILDHVIYTNMVTTEQAKNFDSVKFCPSIFQKYTEKSYELRITVVGEKIFPVKIYSQDDLNTSIDWRTKPERNDFSVKLESIEIPSEIKVKILDFMKELGLRFGCIDMIVTPLGEYVFLEVNPSGQWYFVQLKTELKIADAIADLLLS